MTMARNDGQTGWYATEMMSSARDSAVQLLGRGPGRCLDLGCGTGRALPALAGAGWSVVGTDVSFDQLEAAREHAGDLARLVRGDAHALPFGCFASPFVAREAAAAIEGAAAILRPGYRSAGWHRLPVDAGSMKIRARVGINHLPLADLVNAIIRSGFTITQVDEPGEADPPVFLALRSTKL